MMLNSQKRSCYIEKNDLIIGTEIEELIMEDINIPGRWDKVINEMINFYELDSKAKILDIGAAKGFYFMTLKNITRM